MLLSDLGDGQWHLDLQERHRAKEPCLLMTSFSAAVLFGSFVSERTCEILEPNAALIDSTEYAGQRGQPRVYTQRQMRFFVSCSELVIDFACLPYLRQKKTLNPHHFIQWWYWRAWIRVCSLVARAEAPSLHENPICFGQVVACSEKNWENFAQSHSHSRYVSVAVCQGFILSAAVDTQCYQILCERLIAGAPTERDSANFATP